jgi:hypothetical protein
MPSVLFYVDYYCLPTGCRTNAVFVIECETYVLRETSVNFGSTTFVD